MFPARILWDLLARLFSAEPHGEVVTTTAESPEMPEVLWHSLVTYEQVTSPPPPLLRLLLPLPIGTSGDKERLGAHIDCLYATGRLTKRIIAVEPPRHLAFEVLSQHLGIESCVIALKGSYTISPSPGGTRVVLVTHYMATLGPRWCWRPIEHSLTHSLHRHILKGMWTLAANAAETAACRI
jgi:hypothetical protein